MGSKVQIASAALRKLGENPILLMTDDSKAARTMNNMFDAVVEQELRRVRWNFAIKRVQLSALVEQPMGYAYQYPTPADFLSLIQVGEYYVRSGAKHKPPFSMEGGVILSDMPAPLFIRYVMRVSNPGLFDPLFEEVVSCKLAMEACETLTQSESKFQRCAEQFKYAMQQAVQADAIEGPPDEYPWGSWLDSRQSDGVGHQGGGAGFTAYPSGI